MKIKINIIAEKSMTKTIVLTSQADFTVKCYGIIFALHFSEVKGQIACVCNQPMSLEINGKVNLLASKKDYLFTQNSVNKLVFPATDLLIAFEIKVGELHE